MVRDAFVLKIRRELYHPKCARKVSGLSRNGSLNFFTLKVGGRLFEARRLLNFHLFHKVVDLFCNKTINKNKLRRCTKAVIKHDIADGTLGKFQHFHGLLDNELRDCKPVK